MSFKIDGFETKFIILIKSYFRTQIWTNSRWIFWPSCAPNWIWWNRRNCRVHLTHCRSLLILKLFQLQTIKSILKIFVKIFAYFLWQIFGKISKMTKLTHSLCHILSLSIRNRPRVTRSEIFWLSLVLVRSGSRFRNFGRSAPLGPGISIFSVLHLVLNLRTERPWCLQPWRVLT